MKNKVLPAGTYIVEANSSELTEGTHVIPGVYRDGTKTVYLLTDFGISDESPEIGSGKTKWNLELKRGYESHPFEITITDMDDDNERSRKESFILALRRHSHCNNPENSNYKFVTPSFKVINKADKINERVGIIKGKGSVYNYISDLTFEELRDLEFAEGGNAIGKTYDDLFVKWADFDTSPAMIDPENFMRKQKGSDRAIEVIVNKAIRLLIVEQRDGYYYISGELIGKSVADVINYCKENTEKYEKHILPMVRKSDVLLETPEKSARIVANPNEEAKQEQAKRDELRKICFQKGIHYNHTWTSSKLEALIQEYDNAPENSTLRKEAKIMAKENEKVGEKVRMKTVVAYLKTYNVPHVEGDTLENLEKAMKNHQLEKAAAAL
jgi:hypothetical protein